MSKHIAEHLTEYLAALAELHIGQNKISTLPANFSALPKIKVIDLGNNQFSSMPTDFQKFLGYQIPFIYKETIIPPPT